LIGSFAAAQKHRRNLSRAGTRWLLLNRCCGPVVKKILSTPRHYFDSETQSFAQR
jgi:hypothetical protein